MALTPQPLMRAQDTVTTTVLGPIVPKNWKTHANKIGDLTLANPNAAEPQAVQSDYAGGVRGDDVTQGTRNEAKTQASGAAATTPLGPFTQQDKATALGVPFVQDVGRNRGWIAPSQPYAAPPATPANDPTLASLSPATAVSGANPPFTVKLIGTKFTPYTTVTVANAPYPFKYISPTEIWVVFDPRSAVPGTTTVTATDHGITTVSRTFTWT